MTSIFQQQNDTAVKYQHGKLFSQIFHYRDMHSQTLRLSVYVRGFDKFTNQSFCQGRRNVTLKTKVDVESVTEIGQAGGHSTSSLSK